MKLDYYEVLSVSRNCDEKTLKAAFRKLAKEYHPDRNPGCEISEQKFKEIAEAYDILKDPDKRAAYDRYGHQAFANGGYREGGFSDFSGANFTDFFDEILGGFGGGWRQSKTNQRQGEDISHKIIISLEEAYTGKVLDIKVAGFSNCGACKGSGSAKNSKPKVCPTCQGRGAVRVMHGFFAVERPCSQCQGRGEIIADPCKDCQGTGRVKEDRVLSISVPAGIEDGTRLRLIGEGEAGRNGGSAGDLYIFVSVKPHDFFQRDGENLYCSIPISMTTAALGGVFAVTTLDKVKTSVKVPESVQTGTQFRLKDKGMPIFRESRKGDLYIQVTVETPQNLTKKQKELLETFAREAGQEQNSPQSHGFFSKMKDFFEYISGAPS